MEYNRKHIKVIVQPRKIKPQAKIDNFAFKNGNFVIEGIIQKTIFKCFFYSYRFLLNFKKWCDSDESWIIFSGKRFSTT